MSKNLLRKYMDDRLTDDDLNPIERLKHNVKKSDDDKERTLTLKKTRKSKERNFVWDDTL